MSIVKPAFNASSGLPSQYRGGDSGTTNKLQYLNGMAGEEQITSLRDFKRVVCLTETDMSSVSNNDVIYSPESDYVIERFFIKNIGTAAFNIATSATIDIRGTDYSGNFRNLAAGNSHFTYKQPARFSADQDILWDFGGTNSSTSDAIAKILFQFLFIDAYDSSTDEYMHNYAGLLDSTGVSGGDPLSGG